ncbi:hypothetical protein LUZ60_017499 [Juncus effusus]|nr:hypothetical protein LUZ60_017499 [Juncus effusus]
MKMEKLGRKNPNYQPSPWDGFFINSAIPLYSTKPEECLKERAGELKEIIRSIIVSNIDIVETMKLVDSVQHLGIDYHFEKEIDDVLERLLETKFESNDLHEVALHFRLLRQHGFHVPADEFHKFKDDSGNFSSTISGDVRGLLSLYNAAHMLIHGEEILEEAICFTREHLAAKVDELKPPLSKQVSRSLKSPLIRTMKRLEARWYIEEYEEEEESRNDVLLEFAKLDFNFVQRLHWEELKALSLWWKELDLKENLVYARNRITECFFWICGVYFEPHFSHARIINTKWIALISVLDDTHDVYGTLEELRLLTQAFIRWDEKCVDMLPEYLKVFYLKVLDTAKKVEYELKPSEKYRAGYFIQMFKIMAEAFQKESEWYAADYFPKYAERREHAVLKSSGYPALSTVSFIGMGEIVTKEAFEWVTSIPKVVRASAEVARFTDDVIGYEREHKIGQVASTFDCYMKEFNANVEETTIKFYSLVEDAWRTINQECLKPTAVSLKLIERPVNYARMMQIIYTHAGDGYNKCENLKEFVALLFVKPFSV